MNNDGESTTDSNRRTINDLLNEWNFHRCQLEHSLDKARTQFVSSGKINEFPQCNWFEEEVLLFQDTMAESVAIINGQYSSGNELKMRNSVDLATQELSAIILRLQSLLQ